MCIIAGKKSASWHLFAVVKGPKQRKAAKNDAKTSPKSKFALTASVIFRLPSLLKFFPGMMCIYYFRT